MHNSHFDQWLQYFCTEYIAPSFVTYFYPTSPVPGYNADDEVLHVVFQVVMVFNQMTSFEMTDEVSWNLEELVFNGFMAWESSQYRTEFCEIRD